MAACFNYTKIFETKSVILPHTPENTQNAVVNQLTAMLTPVTPESKFTAKSEPRPDIADVKSALKK